MLTQAAAVSDLAGCRERAAVNAQASPRTGAAPKNQAHSEAAVAQDPLPALRRRVRADDVDGALEQLERLAGTRADGPALAYLRARLYERKQRIGEALASLPENLNALPDEVAQDIHRRRAFWQANEGECTQAARAIESRGRSDTTLSLHVASCALAQGDASTALAVLQDVRGSARRSFDVRYAVSQALLQAGDKDAAERELRSLYLDHPEHRDAEQVATRLHELLGTFRPSDEERFARVQRWLDVARPEEALEELAHITLKPARDAKAKKALRAQRARLLHLKGMALFRTRTRYAEASKVLAQAAAQGGPTQPEDAFHSAQALARADRDRESVKAYYRFAKTYPRDRLATSALQNAAWLELRHDFPGGEAHMRAILKRAERSRSKRSLSEPLWQLAQYAFKHKRYSRALPLFERYATTADGPMVKARGLYWAGRCAALSGKKAPALRHYREAMAVEPLHWYALLARNRIVAAGEDPGPPLPDDVTAHTRSPDQIQPIALPPAAAFYAELGLDEDAVEALRARETSWRRQGNAGLVELLAAYHTLGEYRRPYQLAARERHDTLLQPAGPEQSAIWTALYPRPYASTVKLSAQKEDIPQEIVFSVMRKESAFQPDVVSSADAIGLLQLIVATGRTNAVELGIESFERRTLFEPTMNIRIGTHYLGKLVRHYGGQAIPAIAAYNAGEHKVDDWLRRATRRAKHVELDWFVEDIPFEQTRNYVRLVVTNWARYAYLEQPEAAWPLELPPSLAPHPKMSLK